jgi:putative tryptophan/tyrosine transport system substrate-binding protein
VAAPALRVQLQYENIHRPEDVDKVFRATSKGVDAILFLNNPLFLSRRAQLSDLVAKSRLPAMYDASDFVEAGGLIFYGRDALDLFKRAAVYAEKILKGAKPAPPMKLSPLRWLIGLVALGIVYFLLRFFGLL